MVTTIYAEDIEVGDELDFDGDEYADNEKAVYTYAVVLDITECYGNHNEPWVNVTTSQGNFDMPAGHQVRKKLDS